MLERIPVIGQKYSDEEVDEERQQDEEETKEDNSQSGLAKKAEEQGIAGLLILNAPEAFNELQSHWDEEPMQVYFLVFSLLMSATMLTFLYLGHTTLLIAAFIIYAVIVVPTLYIYEEDEYIWAQNNN